MNKEQIEQMVYTIVRQELSYTGELSHAVAFDDLHADSMDVIMIITDVEDKLNVEVDDDRLATMKTLGEVIDYADELVNGK